MQNSLFRGVIIAAAATLCVTIAAPTVGAFNIDPIDLSHAVIVSPFAGSKQPQGEAVKMLREEIERRTKLPLRVSETWPDEAQTLIVLTTVDRTTDGPRPYPARKGEDLPENRPEGYRIFAEKILERPTVIWAVGADARGMLFAVGGLLRSLHWTHRDLWAEHGLHVSTAPTYPLRGHQLGYRAKANTYDAWSPKVYEQYIRDLMVFGTNAIEQIPLEEPWHSPFFPVPRAEMNAAMSEICHRYGIEYWMWMPVMEHRDEKIGAQALGTKEVRKRMLAKWEALFQDCPRIDGVFVPSSDPGINKADLLMPFVEQAGKILRKRHPDAKIWISHQGMADLKADFGDNAQDYMYGFIGEKPRDWFGGIAFGPWTQSTYAETRTRLPKEYGQRNYPDITHTVRNQFPVIDWDRAYWLTLGRECINPQPVAERRIHNMFAPDTVGFITYSDGIHDDLNKFVWSAMGWNPNQDIRIMLTEYARALIRDDLAETIADGILALEKNWEGPLATNASVDGTLRLWQELEERAPQEAQLNWRFQHGLFRAYYDAYVRHRLIHERELERRTLEFLAQAGSPDPVTTLPWSAKEMMFRAEAILREADIHPPKPEWRDHIFVIADRMMNTIGHQISVTRHAQLDYDRGTMLDTIDHPLNNRLWIEDRFVRIRELPTEEARVAALHELVAYESPVPGTFYDDLADVGNQEHLVRKMGWTMDPHLLYTLNGAHQDWSAYLDRKRLSQQDGIGCYPFWAPDWEVELRYVSVNRETPYRFRVGCVKGESSEYALYADDQELKPMGLAKSLDIYEEYSVPASLTADGTLSIRWEVKEGNGIHITEAWLIPQE